MKAALFKKARRQRRVRSRIKEMRHPRPRLSVFRSNTHIYAQIINDQDGTTLASASSLADLKKDLGKKTATKESARKVGKLVGERAAKAGVTEVIFDKGSYRYHGQVAELAEGAREAGLKF